jgi:hypothetical protein
MSRAQIIEKSGARAAQANKREQVDGDHRQERSKAVLDLGATG